MNIDTLLSPRTGLAFQLAQGGRIRIEDVEGEQVSDLVLFASDDPTERLSQANTRKLNGTWLLTKDSAAVQHKVPTARAHHRRYRRPARSAVIVLQPIRLSLAL